MTLASKDPKLNAEAKELRKILSVIYTQKRSIDQDNKVLKSEINYLYNEFSLFLSDDRLFEYSDVILPELSLRENFPVVTSRQKLITRLERFKDKLSYLSLKKNINDPNVKDLFDNKIKHLSNSTDQILQIINNIELAEQRVKVCLGKFEERSNQFLHSMDGSHIYSIPVQANAHDITNLQSAITIFFVILLISLISIIALYLFQYYQIMQPILTVASQTHRYIVSDILPSTTPRSIFNEVNKVINSLQVCTSLIHQERNHHNELENEFENLNKNINIDPLTGILNRRILEQKILSREVWNDVIVVMIDLDKFKEINDNMGHLSGDILLKDTASLLIKSFNNQAEIYRYGGDEFCIIISHTKVADVILKLKEFSKNIEIYWNDKKTSFINDKHISMSVSIGFSSPSSKYNLKNLQELLYEADIALYHSKHNGRNKVSRFDLVLGPVEA